jgi:sugar lactone lactonase YvrE
MKKILILITFLCFNFSNKIANSDGHLEIVWETEKIFELPESVIYDSQNDVLYVSNITDHPFNKDGTGYISKIGLDGKIIKKKWIDSLNAPKGLTISNGKLFIADIDELVEVDISTNKITNKYKGYGSVCMNDVTADKYGNIYVGDTYTDTIYRLNQFGQLPAWFYSPQLAPNGLHIDDEEGNLIVGSWGALMEGWGTPELKGSLKSINIHTKKLKNLGKKPIGNLDGIESDGKGAYFVTDWTGAKLYRVKKNGKFKVVADVGKGAADLEVILEKNLVIIPIMAEGKVIALKVK